MSGLIHDHAYQASKDALCSRYPRVGDVLDAIEWALVRDDDCDRDFYPLILGGPRGNVRCFASSRISPGIVVIFGFEDHGGARKVVLLEAFALAV